MKTCSTAWLIAIVTLLVSGGGAIAQTCADQHSACLQRKHTHKECKVSTDRCLQTGRWIGPAGREFPISKKK